MRSRPRRWRPRTGTELIPIIAAHLLTVGVAGSTDHKDDRECQWQANRESPGNRQAECRKQIYLRAQPICRHAVFSDAGEQTADAVTASARRHLSWVQERVRRNSYREANDRSGAFGAAS